MEIGMEIVLGNGRKIEMRSLMQNGTYEGMLEGIPIRKWNDRLIQEAVVHASKLPSDNSAVHLIEPPRKALESPATWAGQPTECLPSIRCVAWFRSFSAAPNPNADFSELTLVWFQGEFALPIDSSVLQSIQNLDWDNLAEDFSWTEM
jgi:hypothetical protein